MKKEMYDGLLARRSVRSYKPQQITKKELDAVLEAGKFAPTARNRQCPLMVAVQDKALRDELSAMNAAVMGSSSDPFYGAPTVVVVFTPSDISTGVADGSLVMGNLMNGAYAVGLGSCWINRAKEMFMTERGKELMKLWGVPENYEGVGNCILGYVEGELPAAAPRKEGYVIYA